jgi:hypothetical protein
MSALCNPEDTVKVAKAIEGAGGEAYISRVAETGLRIETPSS